MMSDIYIKLYIIFQYLRDESISDWLNQSLI